jgi:SAM-dependent methyltransferase
MNLDDLQRHWNAFGEQDPLWAILTDPARKGGRWDVAEFFATGDAEVQALMADAAGFGLPAGRQRGLDFGCGVGRLTQALAAHVDEVVGLDVAPSMIAHAQGFNRHGDRVRYAVQPAPPLDAIATRSIDVVITGRVLQHIAPEYSRRYVAELARVLAPGGFLSFDLPSRALDVPALPDGAMAPSAYRAALAATRRSSGPDEVVVDVTVTNASDTAWPAGLSLNLGSHWLTAGGAVTAFDGPRVALSLPLGPGESAALVYVIARPTDPDAAVLELDLVHEGVTWFGWLGSPTARLAVALEAPAAAPQPPAAAGSDFTAVMEMHAVPRPEVEAILDQAGVRLLQVRPEFHCGPRWEAWRYDVTMDARG